MYPFSVTAVKNTVSDTHMHVKGRIMFEEVEDIILLGWLHEKIT